MGLQCFRSAPDRAGGGLRHRRTDSSGLRRIAVRLRADFDAFGGHLPEGVRVASRNQRCDIGVGEHLHGQHRAGRAVGEVRREQHIADAGDRLDRRGVDRNRDLAPRGTGVARHRHDRPPTETVAGGRRLCWRGTDGIHPRSGSDQFRCREQRATDRERADLTPAQAVVAAVQRAYRLLATPWLGGDPQERAVVEPGGRAVADRQRLGRADLDRPPRHRRRAEHRICRARCGRSHLGGGGRFGKR